MIMYAGQEREGSKMTGGIGEIETQVYLNVAAGSEKIAEVGWREVRGGGFLSENGGEFNGRKEQWRK